MGKLMLKSAGLNGWRKQTEVCVERNVPTGSRMITEVEKQTDRFSLSSFHIYYHAQSRLEVEA